MKIIGLVMVALPFLLMFGYITYKDGIITTAKVLGVTISAFMIIGTGTFLAMGGTLHEVQYLYTSILNYFNTL